MFVLASLSHRPIQVITVQIACAWIHRRGGFVSPGQGPFPWNCTVGICQAVPKCLVGQAATFLGHTDRWYQHAIHGWPLDGRLYGRSRLTSGFWLNFCKPKRWVRCVKGCQVFDYLIGLPKNDPRGILSQSVCSNTSQRLSSWPAVKLLALNSMSTRP